MRDNLRTMFPGLEDTYAPAVAGSPAFLRANLCDSNGQLPDGSLHTRFWNSHTREFERPAAAEYTAILLNTRVWTKAEFLFWLPLARDDINHALVRAQCYANRGQTLRRAVSQPMQLNRVREVTLLSPEEARRSFSTRSWATRYHDAWHAYRWNIRYDDEWSDDLLDYWACSIDAGDPRVLMHVWHATQTPQTPQAVSPVFGLLQGLMRRAPVSNAAEWDAFVQNLFTCPPGNLLPPPTVPYDDAQLDTLYFEPSRTRHEADQSQTAAAGLELADAKEHDADLIFQRALVMAARGVSVTEQREISQQPEFQPLVQSGQLIRRTFVLCRTPAATNRVLAHVNANRGAYARYAGYDFFQDATWGAVTDAGRSRVDWQGALFVLYAPNNAWGTSVFEWFYGGGGGGGGGGAPQGLALEEDYEEWEFPVQSMETHIRVTHTNVFRSFVASHYMRKGVDNTPDTAVPVKLEHVERMMPLLVLRYV